MTVTLEPRLRSGVALPKALGSQRFKRRPSPFRTGGMPGATVNVTAGGGTGALSLSSINPSSGRVGTSVALYGSGFAATGNDVHFGVGGTKNLSSNGNTISFLVLSYVSPCDLLQSGYVCGAPSTQVVPGTYPVYVVSGAGATNVLNFTLIP